MILDTIENKNKVIAELEAFINDLKNGDIFIIPNKIYQYNSDFCAISFETLYRHTGRYTFELEVFDTRLKGKKVWKIL